MKSKTHLCKIHNVEYYIVCKVCERIRKIKELFLAMLESEDE